jgi:transcription elongation GreA/GreB family factor
MSRAKENDEELTAGELPERPLSAHPNYVTPQGLALLRARLAELHAERDQLAAAADPLQRQRLLEVKRDIRYFTAQLDRAELVDPAAQPHDEVHFGATVTLVDEDGRLHVFYIVGDDEADPAHNRLSWATPLARALIGARVGDSVKWQRPAGAAEVEIAAIDYAVGAAARRGK